MHAYLRALQDSETSSEPLALTTSHQNNRGFEFSLSFVVSIVAAVFLCLCFREYYRKKYQVDFCPVLVIKPRRETQEDGDRAYAQELQRQLDLENSQVELEAKRKDRREWYESYIVPYTMVSRGIAVELIIKIYIQVTYIKQFIWIDLYLDQSIPKIK